VSETESGRATGRKSVKGLIEGVEDVTGIGERSAARVTARFALRQGH
jgi:hypothetical protein